MPGASQRFGIEHMDLDLELRLRRIEQALEQKLDANPRADPWGAINLPVPRVTGLALGEVVNGWAVEWTPLDIPDLRKYEIRVSTTIDFAIFTEYSTRTNRLTFTDDTSTEAKYIKVRAASLSKRRSIWSSILDTSTGGLVNTGDIEIGAISQFTELDIPFVDGVTKHLYDGTAGATEGVSGDKTPTATEDLYGPITITASEGGTVVPFVYCNVEYQSIWYRQPRHGPPGYWYWSTTNPLPFIEPENKAIISVLRRPLGGVDADDTVVEEVTMDWYLTVPSPHWYVATPSSYWEEIIRCYDTMTGSINVPFLPERPGAGTWEYRVKIEVVSDTDAFLYFYPLQLRMRLLEYKV